MDDRFTIGAEPGINLLSEELRQSGIDVIGAVPWGTHFCQFYATRQDLIETLIPYFKAGLEANEFCMWVTSAPLQVNQATEALRDAAPELDRYLRNGQIEILDYSQWYTPSGRFDADTVLQGWTDKLAAARQRGFDGLRLTGNTFWLEQADWVDFTKYEEMVNDVIGAMHMIALCTYSLEKCGLREVMDVITNHQFALIKSAGHWEIIESAAHKKMEQALRESEERLRLAVWASELGVFEWNVLNDRASWENQRMYEIFGRTPQDGPLSKAQFTQQVIHPEDREAFEADLAKAMQPGHLFHTTCRIRRHSDGGLRWIEFSGRFNRDAAGTAFMLTGVIGDITERKQYEEKLQENAARLEQLNHGLLDFAYIASHDLQEPLRKITAFGERLIARASPKLDDEEKDYLARMGSAASRMQAMIENLLVYSRVTTQTSSVAHVDLCQVLADVLSDLEIRIEQSHGRVEVGELPVIEADPLQMRQLFQNLIANALKFHQPDVAPIVKVRSKVAPANMVEIRVEDNGIGFDMELAQKLFQPFQRLVGRSEYEGTGIGLAICQKIVERHKGSLTVQSAPRQGSTFIVTLPVK